MRRSPPRSGVHSSSWLSASSLPWDSPPSRADLFHAGQGVALRRGRALRRATSAIAFRSARATSCRISGSNSTPWRRDFRPPMPNSSARSQSAPNELEQANFAKTRFLAVASHDLRQPLHALGMFIGQLSTPRDAANLKRIVERAEASVAAMNELFDALLDISRIDTQQLSPSVGPFPVQRLLDRLGATYSGQAVRKGLSLRLPATSAWISSDPVLLERILGNLVSNAIRYTRRGGVVVLCRRRGEALRIEVLDSGPGIPADRHQSIFSEFVRLEPATAPKRSKASGSVWP